MRSGLNQHKAFESSKDLLRGVYTKYLILVVIISYYFQIIFDDYFQIFSCRIKLHCVTTNILSQHMCLRNFSTTGPLVVVVIEGITFSLSKDKRQLACSLHYLGNFMPRQF